MAAEWRVLAAPVGPFKDIQAVGPQQGVGEGSTWTPASCDTLGGLLAMFPSRGMPAEAGITRGSTYHISFSLGV